MIKLTPTDIIAICAVFISVVTLGSSIWQGLITRRHNILSVHPRIDLTISIDKSKPFQIIISNTGLGLAIIESIEATLFGKTYYLDSRESLDELFGRFVGNKIDLDGHYNLLIKNFGMPPESINIYASLSSRDNHELFWELIEKNIKNFRIQISYKCLYGNRFIAYYGID